MTDEQTELLKQILAELKKMNQKLDLTNMNLDAIASK
jgi:hypothetical protein